MVEQRLHLVRDEAAEDEELGVHDARFADGDAFLDRGDAECLHALALEHTRRLGDAVAVRVRLDDGDDRRLAADAALELRVVRAERGAIDLRDRWTALTSLHAKPTSDIEWELRRRGIPETAGFLREPCHVVKE